MQPDCFLELIAGRNADALLATVALATFASVLSAGVGLMLCTWTARTVSSADDPFVDYPQRISYLIDPDGMIAKAYEVSDPAGHGAEVLTDLAALQS